MKLLHIAAHMGGGIGSAYIGLGTCGQEQKIFLLEPPQNRLAVERVAAAGFQIIEGANRSQIERELRWADVVIFSWHHHPAMTKFLHDFPPVAVNSALWCHVSGNYFPAVSTDFLKLFDQCIFATPFTMDLPQIRALGNKYLQEHCGVVYGLNDLSRFAQIQKRPHKTYTIGYVGTLGFCKLHPDFVKFCAAVDNPDTQFLMVGTSSTKEQLLEDAGRQGIAPQFYFCGQVADVAPALAGMDVFSYLLNPQHFGATENALLEAMAAGLPVIALNQCVERHIIRDGVTGLLVHSPDEYGNAVRYLRENPGKAAQIGAQARADVIERYELQANRQRFLDACQRAADRVKHLHAFAQFYYGEPADWFLSCVGVDRQCFEENRPQEAGLIFHERTKGSPVHYHNYFLKDARLNQWAEHLLG